MEMRSVSEHNVPKINAGGVLSKEVSTLILVSSDFHLFFITITLKLK